MSAYSTRKSRRRYLVRPALLEEWSRQNIIALKRISLKENSVIEEVWSAEIEKGRSYICSLHIYDDYVIMTVLDSIDVTTSLYVYDLNEEKLVIENDASKSFAGYCSGNLVYINDAMQQLELFNLEKGVIEKTLTLENYKSGSSFGCDADYIYVNADIEIFPGATAVGDASQTTYIQIYSYDGLLVDTLEISPELMDYFYPRYLCSNNSFVFFGNATPFYIPAPLVLDKSLIGSGKKLEVIPVNGIMRDNNN